MSNCDVAFVWTGLYFRMTLRYVDMLLQLVGPSLRGRHSASMSLSDSIPRAIFHSFVSRQVY